MAKGAARTVHKIPATVCISAQNETAAPKKRRVAGYARVSTDSDEQFTSYEAQIDYYTRFIQSHEGWEFVRVYADEGISGLLTKHREGFNEMIEDALAGRIDLIVTKSVSRFARNTVDSLVTIRQLKEAGCECYFEKENIYTFDGKGELLLTIMASLAQEESRSISENVTWGQRKRFADGKVSMPYKHFLGYEKGPDGQPKIVPEQAETVRHIYDLFLRGMTVSRIARQLELEGRRSPSGREHWSPSTVKSILTNEKYKGDARLQKTFTVDFLTKKTKANEGEIPQYYVENSHEAIVSEEIFNSVQEEMERRSALGASYSGKSLLSSKLVCGDCGGFYGPKLWHSRDRYRTTIWQCNSKFKGEQKCATPHLKEAEIKERFLTAFNQLIPDKERLLDECRVMQMALTDTAELDAEAKALREEAEVVSEMIRRYVDENSTVALDQDAYLAKYQSLADRYTEIQTRIKRVEKKQKERNAKADAIGGMMFRLRELDQAVEFFDDRLWQTVVERVTVSQDGTLTFRFRNDLEVTV